MMIDDDLTRLGMSFTGSRLLTSSSPLNSGMVGRSTYSHLKCLCVMGCIASTTSWLSALLHEVASWQAT